MKNLFLFVFLVSNLIANAQVEDYITNLDGPAGVTIDGTMLYYTESSSGNVSRVDITEDNPVPEIIGSDLGTIGSLELYENNLYVGEFGSFASLFQGKIFKIDLGTLNISEIASGLEFGSVNRILIYEDYLYFTETNNLNLGYKRFAKINLSLPNPEIEVLDTSSGSFGGLSIYGSYIYFEKNGRIYRIDATADTFVSELIYENFPLLGGRTYLKVINHFLILMPVTKDKVLYVDLNQSSFTINEWITNIDEPIDCIAGLNNFYLAEFGGNKISILEDAALGQEDNNARNNITLSPNPSSSYIQVNNIEGVVSYTIVNMLGQKVLEGTTTPQEQINTQQLPAGMYTMVLDGVSVKKFIKN